MENNNNVLIPETTLLNKGNPSVIKKKEEGGYEPDTEIEIKKEKNGIVGEEEFNQTTWKPEREHNLEYKKFYRIKTFKRNHNNNINNNNVGGTNVSSMKDKMSVEEITRICEWKEISQLGNNRKKIVTHFNETYGVNTPSIAYSLIHIFKLNPNEDIIILLLQKYLHASGLCIPCYKYGSKKTKCFSNVNCKWCHHSSHLNKDSFWNPMKYLHLKRNCKVCNSFINGESCARNRDCQYCHSIEHLSDEIKIKYFNILTAVQKNKKYQDIVTDEILQAFDVTRETEKKNEPNPSDTELIPSLYTQSEKEEEKQRKKENTNVCKECIEQHKKPCINYFLHRKDLTFENCKKMNNCYNCHNEIHMNANSSAFIMTYLHQHNLCFICSKINEESCDCSKEDSIYCHEEVHISFDKVAKRILHKTIQEVQREFIETERTNDEIKEFTEVVDSSKGIEMKTETMNSFRSNTGIKEFGINYQNRDIGNNNRKRNFDMNYYNSERSIKRINRGSIDYVRNNHIDQKRNRRFVRDTSNRNVGNTDIDTFSNTASWKNNNSNNIDKYFKHKNNREQINNRRYQTLYKNKSFFGRNQNNELGKEELNKEINKSDVFNDMHENNKQKEYEESYKSKKENTTIEIKAYNEINTNPTMQ